MRAGDVDLALVTIQKHAERVLRRGGFPKYGYDQQDRLVLIDNGTESPSEGLGWPRSSTR